MILYPLRTNQKHCLFYHTNSRLTQGRIETFFTLELLKILPGGGCFIKSGFVRLNKFSFDFCTTQQWVYREMVVTINSVWKKTKPLGRCRNEATLNRKSIGSRQSSHSTRLLRFSASYISTYFFPLAPRSVSPTQLIGV